MRQIREINKKYGGISDRQKKKMGGKTKSFGET